MPSLSTLFILATTALAAFTSAAPVDVSPDAKNVVDSLAVAGNAARSDEINSIPVILTAAKTRMTSISDRLNVIVSGETANTQDLILIVQDTQGVVQDTLVAVRGVPVGAVLSLPGKIIAPIGVAQLLVDVLSLVLHVLATVLGLVKVLDRGLITPLIAVIGELLAQIIAAVIGSVDGILAIVVSLIGDILPLVRYLGLNYVLAVLQIV